MRVPFCLAVASLMLAGCCLRLPGSPSIEPGVPLTPAVPSGPGSRSTDPTLTTELHSPPTESMSDGGMTDEPSAQLTPGDRAGTYWVTNPSSGARLAVRVYYPTGGGAESLPAVLLVPGGTGTIDAAKARRLAEENLIVITFDPDGRGWSGGQEDYGGFIHQDGLAAVAQAARSIPGVNSGRFGLVSYSYGITIASGALSRFPNLGLAFLIDWEGPADRSDTTVGCGAHPSSTAWQPCDDEAFWSEREALRFIAGIGVPYQRIQSQSDHVQPNNDHAVILLNAAVEGGVPWARLNDYPPGRTFDPAHPPPMLPESQDRLLERQIAAYVVEILEMLGR